MGSSSPIGGAAVACGRVSKSVFVAGPLKELSCTLHHGHGLMFGQPLVACAGGCHFMHGFEVPVEAAADV